MKIFSTVIVSFLLFVNSAVFAQGSSPCSPYSLSVGSSYSPSSYSLMGVLKNYIPLPSCDRGIMSSSGTGSSTLEPGLWFSFTVPSSGIISLKTESVSVANNDIGLSIFRKTGGSCPSTLNLTEVTCISNGNNYMPAQNSINLSSYNGQTLYIRVWKYGSAYNFGSFRIGLWSACTAPNTPVISGNTTSCTGSTTLSISSPQSGVTYNWSNGASGTQTNVYNSSSITVTATSSCGNATSQPFNVTIASAPTMPTISGNTTSCDGSVILEISSPQDGVTYRWSNGTTGNQATFSASANVTVMASNSCGSNTSQSTSVTILPPLSMPSISGTLTACNSTTLRVSNSQNGVTYTWSNGQTGTSVMVSESMSYTVTAQRDGCNPITSTPSDVVINRTPTPPTIQGETNPVCPNDQIQVSVENPCQGCQYRWSNGSTEPTISVQATANLVLTATLTTPCGQATSQSYRPTLLSKPATPTIIGNANICASGGQTELSVSNPDPNLTYTWSTTDQGTNVRVSRVGVYTVKAVHPTCNFGNITSAGFAVSAYATIKPTISVAGNRLSITNAHLFQTFQWYKNGQPLPNTTSSHTLTGAGGNVSVETTDANGCVEKSAPQYIVATKEFEEDKNHIQVYPNPTHGNFSIALNSPEPSLLSLSIFNAIGQVVYQLSPKEVSGQTVINVPFDGQTAGEYLVRLSINDKITTRKLVIIN